MALSNRVLNLRTKKDRQSGGPIEGGILGSDILSEAITLSLIIANLNVNLCSNLEDRFLKLFPNGGAGVAHLVSDLLL